MFVTSDVFDLKAIGRWRGFDWQENLLGGIAIYGTDWRGYQADAGFLLEASSRCGILGDMKWAGYDRPGEQRTRNIKPASFERLARGELAGPKEAVGLLLRGERAALGSQNGYLLVGGTTSASARVMRGPTGPSVVPNYPYRAFEADFVFPMPDQAVDFAIKLLKLSVELLAAEYGYYFVRDDLCGPCLYDSGMSPALDAGRLAAKEGKESLAWRDFVSAGRLWTGAWPALRDLYEINLLSARHTSVPIEGLGFLTDWIEAGPGRGRIEDIGDGRLLWILTDAEMLETRPLLIEAGVVMARIERVYRDLDPGTGVKPSASEWCYTSG